MFKNSAKIMFTMILILGTLITISSNSWIGSWLGLEINLLAFIPLMTSTKNLMSSESSMKYFLVQALASSVILFTMTLMLMKINTNYYLTMNNNLAEMMLLSALLMKSGAPPFHFWFPGVMEGLSWMKSLLLMTWQKIAPLTLITYLSNPSIFFYIIIILSIIIGSLGGLNQTSLRKLMAFSSINHIGWMLAAMLTDDLMWSFYFIMYSFLSMTIIILFSLFKVFHFNQLFTMPYKSRPLKFIMFSNLLSLGGLPPFLGFLPKWLIIQSLIFNNQSFLMVIMTTFTLITLFFYLRLTFSAFMLNYNEISWNKLMLMNKYTTPPLMLLSSISILGLPLMSLIYYT